MKKFLYPTLTRQLTFSLVNFPLYINIKSWRGVSILNFCNTNISANRSVTAKELAEKVYFSASLDVTVDTKPVSPRQSKRPRLKAFRANLTEKARRDSKVAKPTATYMLFRLIHIMLLKYMIIEEMSPKS